jgi:phosphate transport system permease protein
MNTSMLLIVAMLLVAMAFVLGRKRSIAIAGGRQGVRNLNSLPSYYGVL